MNKSVPIVAIVGRANVGKSSLFNCLIGRREAIVAAEAGTTRDNVTAKARIGNKDFWLVDTAGLKDPRDDFELSIQDQIHQAAEDADLIIVVVEAGVPVSEEDRRVSKMALRAKKPLILVINKLDQNPNLITSQWRTLAIEDIVATSATQKKGIEEMAGLIGAVLPSAKIKEDSNRIKAALLGRPNVGKSSLFNSLAKKQQAVVASKAGTTRDVNRVVIKFEGREIEFSDTAGIRRSGKIERGVEHFSVLRSLAAIEESDVGLLLMDVNELSVQLDQKIAGLIKDAGKGLILVVTKWDQLDKEVSSREDIARQVAANFSFVPWAPLVFTSSVTGQNVAKLFEQITQICQEREARFTTPELNNWLSLVTNQHPPAGLKNRNPKLNYMVQEDDIDMPSFKIFGAHTKFLHWSYKRYLERKFREKWPLPGTPLKFWFIEKH